MLAQSRTAPSTGNQTSTWLRRTRRSAPAPLVVAALLVALLMLATPVYLLVRATEAGSGAFDLLLRDRTREVMWNSLQLAGAVALGAALIGVPFAWLLERTNLPARRFFSILAPLPLAIPSYVGALTYIDAFGPEGSLKRFLERHTSIDSVPSIYGFWGSCIALTLFTFPFVLLQTRASLKQIDPAQDDAARTLGLGPTRTFLRVTLPALRPPIVAGMLLSALYAISDFGVVTLLRYDTLTRAIYTQYRAAFNRNNAAVLALVLVLFAAILVSAEIALRGRTVYHRVGSGALRTPRRIALGYWTPVALLFCGGVLFLALGVPMLVIAWWLIDRQGGVADWDRLLEAGRHSVELGVFTGLITLVLALPVAILSVRYRSRLSSIIERICYLGFGLPGIVIALAFVFFGIRVATPLYQTVALMVVALAVRFLPQALGAERSALLQVNPRQEEAARNLGKTATATFAHVTFPLARPGFVAGFAMVFVSVMKELPVTLILSPIEYRTLATEIWTAWGNGAHSDAAVPALILIVISSLPTLLLRDDNRATKPETDDRIADNPVLS